ISLLESTLRHSGSEQETALAQANGALTQSRAETQRERAAREGAEREREQLQQALEHAEATVATLRAHQESYAAEGESASGEVSKLTERLDIMAQSLRTAEATNNHLFSENTSQAERISELEAEVRDGCEREREREVEVALQGGDKAETDRLLGQWDEVGMLLGVSTPADTLSAINTLLSEAEHIRNQGVLGGEGAEGGAEAGVIANLRSRVSLLVDERDSLAECLSMARQDMTQMTQGEVEDEEMALASQMIEDYRARVAEYEQALEAACQNLSASLPQTQTQTQTVPKERQSQIGSAPRPPKHKRTAEAEGEGEREETVSVAKYNSLAKERDRAEQELFKAVAEVDELKAMLTAMDEGAGQRDRRGGQGAEAEGKQAQAPTYKVMTLRDNPALHRLREMRAAKAEVDKEVAQLKDELRERERAYLAMQASMQHTPMVGGASVNMACPPSQLSRDVSREKRVNQKLRQQVQEREDLLNRFRVQTKKQITKYRTHIEKLT
ncbi:hypothetical protein KIPB_010852, partial [Kipferlia bialata]